MEQENSSILGLNRRDGKQKKKEIAGGATVIVIQGNGNTPPTRGQPFANPKLGAKAP